MIGRTLSTYRVVEKIGEGGMGEVYLARDERLGRDVALKVLPEGRLGDETARSRFRKEAQALLRLSHPHVSTLFDHGRADGVDYLVMERVAGKTLDVALREGPLPEKEVLRLGAQLARGLAAAHEAGILHRDLKPSNLALTSDGLLKILDFGLAQLPAETAVGTRTQDTPTQTGAGAVLGSPPYMPPEQLLGKEADARSDVYSAGACLFELATGRRPHGDKSGPMLVEAILHEAPPPARSLNAGVTPGLEAVVAKAMDKDPSLRYQGARELLVDLERLAQAPSVTVAAAGLPVTRRRGRWAWVAVAALVGVAGVVAWRLRPPAPPRIASVRPLRAGLSWLSTGGILTTWATDGLRVYFVDRRSDRFSLLQMPIDGGDSSEIDVPAAFHEGFEVYGFLPRTSSLLCLTVAGASDAGWPAWVVSVPGGQARRLGSLRGNTAGVSADGTRIALLQLSTRKLVVASEDASVLRTIGPLPQQPVFPRWAPDGKRIRFGGLGPEGREGQPWVWEVAAEGGTPRPVAPGEQGAWTRDGRFFLIERWNDAERRFDLFVTPDRASLPGALEPRPLTNGPLSFRFASERPDARGLLAFGQDARGELRRYDAGTRRFAPFVGGASAGYVDPSPDGQWLAWVTYPEEELWQGRRNGSERFPLAGAPLRAWMPRWSPDGRRIAFIGRAEGEQHRSVYVVPAGGGAAEVVVPAPEADWWDVCWLSEGSLVFSRRQGATGLQTIDLRSGRVSPVSGSEGLRYPKCGPRGEILATRVSTPWMLVFRRPGQAEWQEAGPNRGVYHSWRRDGRSFCYLRGGAVECDSLDGRSVARHPLEDTPLRWVDAAPWIGLDLDDSPFVTLLTGRPDIYALDWEAP